MLHVVQIINIHEVKKIKIAQLLGVLVISTAKINIIFFTIPLVIEFQKKKLLQVELFFRF